MHSQHDKTSEDASRAKDQVGNAQEGVLAAHPGDCTENDLLGALEGEDRVAVIDVEAVGSTGQASGEVALVDTAVELAEGGQGGGAHPHDEVLVDEACVVGVASIQQVGGTGPVGGLGRAPEGGGQAAVHQLRVAELDVGVGPPGDAPAVQGHRHEGPVDQAVEGEGVVEEAVGNGAAGGHGLAPRVPPVGPALLGWVPQPPGVPAELQVVAGHTVAPVVLVVVGQLVVQAHRPREGLGQFKVQGAEARAGGGAGIGAAGAVLVAAQGARVVQLQLADGARGEVQPQPHGQPGQAQREEERQRDARRQQRLPGRESLLREGRAVRPPPLPPRRRHRRPAPAAAGAPGPAPPS